MDEVVYRLLKSGNEPQEAEQSADKQKHAPQVLASNWTQPKSG
jgi:hypothetical protein